MPYGMLSHVLANFQNSYGTPLATSYQAIPVLSENLELTIGTLREDGMYGRLGEPPFREGPHAVTGTLAMESNGTAIGIPFKSVFGQVDTTSGAGIQTHVFDPVSSDYDTVRSAVQPMTFQVFRDIGSAAQYSDMLGSQLTLEIAHSQLLKVSLDLMGGAMTRVAAATPTFPTADPFVWDQCSGSYNGAPIEDIRDMTITFNNNLEAQYTVCTSKTPFSIKRTEHQMIKATGTLVFNSHSYWQAFESQVENPLVLHWVGTTPFALTVDIPAFRFTKFAPVVAGPGLIEAAFEGVGTYDTGSANNIRITLVNTQEYY